jgi:hypothetical protein
MDFWFEFLDIHMNEQTIISHDNHGFKLQNINIFLILFGFVCSPFLNSLDCDHMVHMNYT